MEIDMARISYVELPAAAIGETRAFYEAAFGWALAEFGPSYAATTGGDVDLGLQGDASEATAKPLICIQTDAIDRAREAVIAAHGHITRDVFAYPGGRRFHFIDPAGNELAVFQPEG
jgi:predicted enzyme related to lactoylglutathione lyase